MRNKGLLLLHLLLVLLLLPLLLALLLALLVQPRHPLNSLNP